MWSGSVARHINIHDNIILHMMMRYYCWCALFVSTPNPNIIVVPPGGLNAHYNQIMFRVVFHCASSLYTHLGRSKQNKPWEQLSGKPSFLIQLERENVWDPFLGSIFFWNHRNHLNMSRNMYGYFLTRQFKTLPQICQISHGMFGLLDAFID